MSRWKRVRERWMPVLVAFVIGAMLTGVAGAHTGFPEFLHANHSDTMLGTLTANNFTFAAPKTSRIAIPAAAFSSSSETASFTRTDSYGYTLNGDQVATAPVNLPDGATVIKVIWVHAAVATPGEAALHLERVGTSLDPQDLAVLSNVGCGTVACTSVDATIDFPVISNAMFGYGLWVENSDSGSDLELYRVVIVYTVARPNR